jgi:hypothetical protein
MYGSGSTHEEGLVTVRALVLRFWPVTLGIACTTLTTVRDPARYLVGHNPQRLWLTPSPGTSTVVMDRPSIAGDTLIGIVDGEPRRVPLAGITLVEANAVSASRTALLAFAAVAVPAVFVYANANSESTSACPPSCPNPKAGCVQVAYCVSPL